MLKLLKLFNPLRLIKEQIKFLSTNWEGWEEDLAAIAPYVGGAVGAYGAYTQAESQKQANKKANEQWETYKPLYEKSVSETLDVYGNRPGYKDPTGQHLESVDAVRDAAGRTGATGRKIGTGLDKAFDFYSGNLEGGNPELLQAQLRDQQRELTEQTLPNLNKQFARAGASESGRRMVAEDVAERGFLDRAADQSAINKDIAAKGLADLGKQGVTLDTAAAGKGLTVDEYLRELALGEEQYDTAGLNILKGGAVGASPRAVSASSPNYASGISAGITAGTDLASILRK